MKSSVTISKGYWTVPYERNPYFTGRAKLLEDLHTSLQVESTTALVQAITGLGGIGKTQTAVIYAHTYVAEYTGGVFWVKADSEANIIAGYAEIAREVDLSVAKDADQKLIVDATTQWLRVNPDWLLVLDNVNDQEFVKRFLPAKHSGRVLITSRRRELDLLGVRNPVSLKNMDPEEAYDFLFIRTGRRSDDLSEKEAAKALVNDLGCLPLALEQACAYIVKLGTSFTNYHVSFQKRRLDLLKFPPVEGDYEGTVATTWDMNFAQLNSNSAAVAVLNISAFLDPDMIPIDVFVKGASSVGSELVSLLSDTPNDPIVIDELLLPLAEYSLISRDADGATFSIHRLVQEVVKAHLQESGNKLQWSQQAISALSEVFPIPEYENWSECKKLLPHALSCIELIGNPPTAEMMTPQAGLLLDNTGRYLSARARYDEASVLFNRAIVIRQTVLGAEHADTSMSLHNAGWIASAQGEYSKAEQLVQCALAIRERVLGADHPDTATSLNNIASLYRSQGRYADAESHYKRALDISERVLGADHPDTARSLNNIANLYWDQGRYADAEPLHKRALAIRERVLGADHPDTAMSLNNIASLYQSQGRYADAESHYKRALDISERVFGADHPDTATSLNNIANLYRYQGRYADAEPLHKRALDINERVLGADHPDTARSLRNLGGYFYIIKEFGKAERCENRALSIYKSRLGKDHPEVGQMMQNYAATLRKLKRNREAQTLENQAKSINIRHEKKNKIVKNEGEQF